MTSLSFSEDQARVLERLHEWSLKPDSRSITLGGYAGTGKTTVIAALRRELAASCPDLSVAFCSYTGKASQVLRQTLIAAGALYPQDTCGTIHSLLYSPLVGEDGTILGWMRSKEIDANLIIVDEASMVTDHIWQDLLIANLPIIAVGDHGQLPPIEGKYNLMDKTDLTLERIHRQAENNPIIQLAQEARLTGKISVGDFSKSVRKFSYATHEASDVNDLVDHLLSNVHDDMLILCGYNKTRVALNKSVRQKLGRESDDPEGGDRVVCLKNTYVTPGSPIYNGMVGTLDSITPEGDHWYAANIAFVDEEREFAGLISRHQFNQPQTIQTVPGLGPKHIGERFDYGYALTVHKSQGSQANTVLLFEERFPKSSDDDWRRWLYTAVTRARENLYIIGRD
ncbi:MAG: AAA family ATPase [Candidatus Uhrbacteria bacterium]